ncbi:MAG: hypothetical protein IT204_23465 [Fimbriimonadaceae bacterium]|nr:hypothetical protein [Fimbriimonadaceae bacterium]
MSLTVAPPAERGTLTRGPEDLSPWSRALRDDVAAHATAYDERLLLVAESFRATADEPQRELRWAHSVETVLRRCPVRVRVGERLVGWHPNCQSDEATRASLQEARAYLHSQQYWCAASEGHLALDYPAILQRGLDDYRREIEQRAGEAGDEAQRVFLAAARQALVALQGYIGRYAELTATLAAEELDPDWRAELQQIAAICRQVVGGPARTWREALQLAWFCLLGVCLEESEIHHCFGLGRLDQWLLPYVVADRTARRLDEAELDDLLDQMQIKCNEFSGRSMSAVIMGVAGRRPDGSSGYNELSHRLLYSSCRVRMYFPGLDIFWHRDLPADFVRDACTLLRNGNGQPSFFNDDLIIAGLRRYGLPYEHAVDHLPSTCTETSIQGRSNPWVAWPYLNLPLALLGALYGGVRPDDGQPVGPATTLPQTYDELLAAFDVQLKHQADEAVRRGNRDQAVAAEARPFPLLSCFIQGCLQQGRNISHGGATYTFLQPEAVGVSNCVDSLAAIRTLVVDRQRYSLDDFRAALTANWEGHEALRRAVQRDCPKYGNDDAWVNDLFAWVAGRWCDHLEGQRNHFGGPVFPGFLGWTVWIQFGQQTPATPDGRAAGEPLANSLAPASGVKLRGVPSMLLSASGLDHARGLGGITFNVRFNGASLAEPGGPERLAAIVGTALGELGLYMTQIEIASTATLRAAQERPADYADLYVRIGGYLVPFTLLGPAAQNEVIGRAELAL